MKNILISLALVTLSNLSFVDGEGDKTKSVLIMEYSDGTVERIVVDKKDIKNSRQKIVEQADKLLQEKESTRGN